MSTLTLVQEIFSEKTIHGRRGWASNSANCCRREVRDEGRENVSTRHLRDLDLILAALVILFVVSIIVWLGLV
jgi:hypothetical protein